MMHTHGNRSIRLLVSNTDRDLLLFVFEVVASLGVSVDSVMPDGTSADDIVQFACTLTGMQVF